ncbi:MAG TPA: AAA family ATPase, partial [Pseudobdellovibrionaceae bacterium]|nr:AAA family ATPase [Pseudobdellovibrionaceae bacterium]
KYTEPALRAAAELSQKHIPAKLLPDKAIDVVDETGAHARMHSPEGEVITIQVAEIEKTVARISGVPVASVTANERMQLKDLDKKLKAAIYGQDSAINKLVTSIKLSRSGLRAGHKPIGNFLFVGPTGVGKTEVCKVLSETLGLPLHRFDMSEYQEKHAVARLVGAPPGYVGFEQGGLLTEAVNKNPYALILLDELEKAHPDIYGVLLQVMDAGRLTDSQGRESDFSHVILVMTSNAGAAETAKGNIGLVEQERSLHSMEAIKKTFSPEFLNRLDAIVPFHSLSEESLMMVVDKFIDELRMQLALKKVDLQISLEAKKWIMKKGYEPAYGARPMGRTIEEYVKKPLVEELLFGRIADGGTVVVSLANAKNSLGNVTETLEFQYSSLAPSLPLPKSSTNPKDPVEA